MDDIRLCILTNGLECNLSVLMLIRPLKGDLPCIESISQFSKINVSKEELMISSWFAKFPIVENLLCDKSNVFRFVAGRNTSLGLRLIHDIK